MFAGLAVQTGLCSLYTTPSLASPLSPPSPFLSGGDGSFSWESALGVGMLMQGSDVGDEQMRLFSILCYCAMAPELETLPTSFPLLLNTGVGTTICIVIYKHCKTLLGPTCINLVFALAFLFSLASLQHSFCLCCMPVRLSSAETKVLLPRASICAAAMLLSSCSEGRAVGTSCSVSLSRPMSRCGCQVPERRVRSGHCRQLARNAKSFPLWLRISC